MAARAFRNMSCASCFSSGVMSLAMIVLLPCYDAGRRMLACRTKPRAFCWGSSPRSSHAGRHGGHRNFRIALRGADAPIKPGSAEEFNGNVGIRLRIREASELAVRPAFCFPESPACLKLTPIKARAFREDARPKSKHHFPTGNLRG